MRASRSRVRASSARVSMPMAPCADRRQKLVDVHDARGAVGEAEALQARRAPGSSHRPRRRRACAAASPHCRAAARCADRAARACAIACRRSDVVPSAAPCGSSASDRRLAADEDIARVLALEAGRQHQPVRQHRRHVLGRMHREIDVAAQQRLLDLLGEQALAAVLGQRPVLDRVAGGADDLELDRRLVQSERRRAAPAPCAPAPAPAGCRGCRCAEVAEDCAR